MAREANSSSIPLAELRRMMEAAAGAASHRPVLPFGIKEIDEALPGGGLALGAVHEFSEEGPRGGYAAYALLFAAGILCGCPGLFCGAFTAGTYSRPRSPGSVFIPTASFSAKPGRTLKSCLQWRRGCACVASQALSANSTAYR